MQSSTQIASRFKEVLLDGKWIANTNFKILLADVNLQQATTQIGSLNTIAALAFHINYYIAGVLQVFEEGKLEIRDKYSFDLPEMSEESDWENLKHTLFSNSEKFAAHVAAMSDEKLDSIFVHEKLGDYRRNIEGMIEHSYYHLGQIVLLKKMILESEK